jgi:hypothetical protein
MSSTTLEALVRLQELFPPGFPAVSECLKAGVRSVRLRKGILFGINASFDPEEMTIDINLEADREQIVATARRRTGVEIKAEEAFAWLLLHEIGHCRRRDQVLALPRRNTIGASGFSFFDGAELAREEYEADTFAKGRLLGWRQSRALEGRGR